ncbi:hypothetical protein NIES2107_53170 [Nostoc carneum NIES-2107]|nr:hypothetical protein NIES2107_53170 [Nostoc carneum NIES-2107]
MRQGGREQGARGDEGDEGDEGENPITHYQLPITHYPLPITHSPFPMPIFKLEVRNWNLILKPVS